MERHGGLSVKAHWSSGNSLRNFFNGSANTDKINRLQVVDVGFAKKSHQLANARASR
jgi:hypothetical protein